LLGVHPGELIFTSGGTESTNTAITAAIRDFGCTRIITAPIEHHATLRVSEFPVATWTSPAWNPFLKDSPEKILVTVMHGNNEICNILNMEAVGELCRLYETLFYCDTVQTIGDYSLDLKKAHVHFINAVAHKFHGPKGVGLLYVNEDIKIKPFMAGGAQERDMRAGTENVYGIVGMAKALEKTLAHYEEDKNHITGLKMYMAARLQNVIPEVTFNGDWNGKSLYTVLNGSFPKNNKTEMLLFNLDINGICGSGGSACSLGASTASHVIAAVNPEPKQVPVRFSFSRENTTEEIDRVVEKLKELI
jgi:cysteine desulfurase